MTSLEETPQTLPYKCKPCLKVGLNFCKFWKTGFDCGVERKPNEEKLPVETLSQVQVYGFKGNPGQVTLLEFKPPEHVDFEVKKYRFQRNPNKVRLFLLNKPPNRLEVYTYRDESHKVWLSLNHEYASFDREELKSLYLTFRKALETLKKPGQARRKPDFHL